MKVNSRKARCRKKSTPRSGNAGASVRKPPAFSLNKLKCRVSALDLAPRIWEAIDTPVSLACALLLKYNEHEQLARKTISAQDYNGMPRKMRWPRKSFASNISC
jgi:hypothetical protein